jgi:cytosine/adenosine deaminase-related metal-dependent hydrolase
VAFVLLGDCVTMAEDPAFVEDAAIYVNDDGLIERVADAGAAPPSGFEAAPRIRSGGVVYPGLIDLHNHIAYNTLGLWIPPGRDPYRADPFDTRYRWSGSAPGYQECISHPAAALGLAAGKELLKYVEVRAIVGGVTSIQGSPQTSGVYEGWLARNVEYETFGGKRTVFQCVFDPGACDLDGYRGHMEDGGTFLFHLAEGRRESEQMHQEFATLDEARCVRRELVGIHCTALGSAEFGRWKGKGAGSVVWSPLSNLFLYGETTDIQAAADEGLRICLGADWGPSGSKNLLAELKVADLYIRDELKAEDRFTRFALCRMVTCDPARAINWGDEVGTVAEGLRADLLIMRRREPDPYDNLVLGTERDVLLVVVRGRPIYGLPSLMRSAGAADDEQITVRGLRRCINLVDPSVPDLDQTWPQIVGRLEEVRRDPAGALASTTRLLMRGEETFRVIPDMPWDRTVLEARAVPGDVVIPPLDPLATDARFLDAIDRAPILAGRLAGLRAYFEA